MSILINKKLIISLSVIGAVAAIAIGTVALFNDTETSSGNIFTAGTLNLKVGDNDPAGWNFQISDIKPGDSGSQEVILQNTGSLDGYLHITFANLINDEMGCPEPEQNEGGDTTCENPGPNEGELAQNLDILIYLDENGNTNFDLGTDNLIYQGKVRGILQGDLFNYPLLSGSSKDFRIEWKLDSSVGNIVQTDKTGYDINFELTQNKKEIVGDWHFDENSGNIAYDSAFEPANNGTINGASWTDGKYNPALSFDGSDYVSTPLNINGYAAVTLEAWVNPGNLAFGATANKMIVSDSIDGWPRNYIAVNRSYQPVFRIQTDTFNIIWETPALSQNVWYHIVGTYDGIKMRIYVNGVEKGSDNLSGNIVASSMTIGYGDWDRFWKGIIDEVRIYNRALSASEILERYNAGI